MNPKNSAFINYTTNSNYNWSNLKKGGVISISSIKKDGKIQTKKQSWNQIPK